VITQVTKTAEEIPILKKRLQTQKIFMCPQEKEI
jgi:hypothetical protein